MKRRNLWWALGLAILLLAGCAPQQAQMTYIGAEEAKRVALETAGVSAAEAETITTDLSTRDGLDYYQVELSAGGQSYRYDIDALTGTVIDSSAPGSPPEDSLVTDADTFHTQQAAAQQPSQPSTQQAPPASQDAAAPVEGGTITADEAKAAALAHAGLTDGQVTFAKSKLDYEDGCQVWEVEFYTQDHQEYDYEIDARTGEVLSYDFDAESYTPPAPGSGNAITAEEAKKLALAQVPGATAADIRKFEVDYDDGRMEYEGEILYGGMEYDFEIDGYSGAIRSWEAEPAGR